VWLTDRVFILMHVTIGEYSNLSKVVRFCSLPKTSGTTAKSRGRIMLVIDSENNSE